eukprot:CAMPEP_0173460322 /NCGR_PEP_ID=MMETSP1357-20121228/62931_1 /TAXON_ID=77926 /ORGANISM="Hemiselmis rufescens, Strain PCC563" /LENGTH=51 /DNA_ID=CAMNT_0014427877 /DNA_START=254 /DNA_END=406 /DNA_ORIENTATION=+
MVDIVEASPLTVRDMPKSLSIWIETKKSVMTMAHPSMRLAARHTPMGGLVT